jgi:hypothetical protein
MPEAGPIQGTLPIRISGAVQKPRLIDPGRESRLLYLCVLLHMKNDFEQIYLKEFCFMGSSTKLQNTIDSFSKAEKSGSLEESILRLQDMIDSLSNKKGGHLGR